jgi:phosphoribosyl 1,2-cyclic phosphodiesterase
MNRIKAVFITHEHSDHTRGVNVIARKYRIPVFISPATHTNSRLKLDKGQVSYFGAYSPVQIGGLSINAFPKQHDASEPHSFTVSGEGITVGVLTDLGSACEHVIRNFKLCNAVFLEANYDEDMLENGNYPIYLKNRIRSDQGHLSNLQSLALFREHRAEYMSHVLLSHLSQDNNNPRLVQDLFAKHAGDVHVSVASRHYESAVYRITGEKAEIKHTIVPASPPMPRQMKLF